MTLSQDLLSIATENRINLPKLLESSLIKFLEAQTKPFSLSEGSLFSKERVLAGPRGIGPLTYGLRVRRSNLAELRAPSELPTIMHILDRFIKLT